MSFFEDTPSFSPVQFFGVVADCHYLRKALKAEKGYLLPDTSDLLGETPFAKVYAGWSVDKLAFHIEVEAPFQGVAESDFRKGDSVELFCDTRDLKTKGTISRFCHHFVFFPAPVQHFCGREITRFRSDDTHRLCHPEDLVVKPDVKKDRYTLSIEIPSDCLHGYDPLSASRLGFTYRINRPKGAPQHFAVSSEEYVIEQHPATWGTLRLVREEEE
ncbi:MAG: hypothetical protein RL235_147 [Chlamydiota bacterium]|jgi:hypothetical protein